MKNLILVSSKALRRADNTSKVIAELLWPLRGETSMVHWKWRDIKVCAASTQ